MDYDIILKPTEKKKIYIDPEEREGIYLYPSEVRKEGLKDHSILSEEALEGLRERYAVPRAKKYALSILSKRDKTEQEIREKLKKSYHDDRSVQDAVDYLTKMGYLDDFSYARDYFYSKRGKKSFRQIIFELEGKGIKHETIQFAMEEEGGQKPEDLRPAFQKYAAKFSGEERKSRQKIYAHFVRKGYAPGLVQKLLNEYESENC